MRLISFICQCPLALCIIIRQIIQLAGDWQSAPFISYNGSSPFTSYWMKSVIHLMQHRIGIDSNSSESARHDGEFALSSSSVTWRRERPSSLHYIVFGCYLCAHSSRVTWVTWRRERPSSLHYIVFGCYLCAHSSRVTFSMGHTGASLKFPIGTPLKTVSQRLGRPFFAHPWGPDRSGYGRERERPLL